MSVNPFCKPCLDRGKKVEASRLVAGDPWCSACFGDGVEKREYSMAPVLPPKRVKVSVSYADKFMGIYREHWGEFFDELEGLLPGESMLVDRIPSQSRHSADWSIRRLAAERGLKLRISHGTGKMAITIRRPGSPAHSVLRQAIKSLPPERSTHV